jgi:5-methylcytosine-specific restriction endonuclease McrBC GTP-binding regulatory subunit McrB
LAFRADSEHRIVVDLAGVREFGKRQAGWLRWFRDWPVEGETTGGNGENMPKVPFSHRQLDEVVALLRNSKRPQVILHGPPGTGKTRLARQAAIRLLCGESHGVDLEAEPAVTAKLAELDGCFKLVVFHPAYEYDQFIGGLRVRAGNPTPVYTDEPGVLVRLVEPNGVEGVPRTDAAVLIIDEINRGQVPRLFGELLYALEYRGASVQLSYREKAFTLPENLYIIGTMNTADRSVDSLDVALRRRFSFFHVPANSGVVQRHWEALGDLEFGKQVASAMDALNKALEGDQDLDGLAVGPSYFLADGPEQLGLQIKHQLDPLLDEYARIAGDSNKAKDWKAKLDALRLDKKKA